MVARRTRELGALGRMVEEYRDAQRGVISDAAIGRAIGVTRGSVGSWLSGDSMPSPENLRALADYMRTSYTRVLDAALVDAGYLQDPSAQVSAPGADGEREKVPRSFLASQVDEAELTAPEARRRTEASKGVRGADPEAHQ